MIEKILKVLKAFTDPKYSKPELRFVFFDNEAECLVASDAKRILVINHDLGLGENMFIDVNNTEIGVNPVDLWRFKAYKENVIGKYPDYKSILVNNGKLTEPISSKLTFAECVYNAGSFTGKPIVVGFSKKYDKLNLPQENTRIHYHNDSRAPFMVSGLVNFGTQRSKKILPVKLVVSPVLI